MGQNFLKLSPGIKRERERERNPDSLLRTFLAAIPTPRWLPKAESYKRRNQLQKKKKGNLKDLLKKMLIFGGGYGALCETSAFLHGYVTCEGEPLCSFPALYVYSGIPLKWPRSIRCKICLYLC